LEQLSGKTNQRPPTLRPILTTTTFAPFAALPDIPRRQSRPILDGLAWLWRTWQDTATGPSTRRPVSSSSSSLTNSQSNNENRVPLPRPGLGLFAFGSNPAGFGASQPAIGTGGADTIGDAGNVVRFENIIKYYQWKYK
jgi:hypothetical protein